MTMSELIEIDALLAEPEGDTAEIQLNILAEIPDNNMELVWMNPRTIAEHDLNWKNHPSLQRESYADFLTEVGWAGALLYNKRSRRLLDGHMRLQDALLRNLDKLPTLSIEVDEETERKILLFLDRIGSMYDMRRQATERLAALVATKSRNLQAILQHRQDELKKRMEAEGGEIEVGEDTADLPEPPELPPGGVSLVLGEAFNYIVLLFKTELDFSAAQDHFGLQKVKCAFNSGVGLGRVVDGSEYLRKTLPRLRPSFRREE